MIENEQFKEYLLVRTKRIMKYMTKTGQKTGKSKAAKKLQTIPMTIARVAEYQNLNSGRRRTNGRNSSSSFVGKPLAFPSSIPSSISKDGSNLGDIKARKIFRR